ncbi:MAG: dTDP-4-dehydrorhamnose reductase [Alphaproteobacteria bacterium]
MKVLVLGAGGQVGRELLRHSWPAAVRLIALGRGELDITRRDAVYATVAGERPDIVVNAAAFTAVDRAESERDAAWAANCAGPANIAAACREAGIKLIHISTDYVFDGTKSGAYREDDPVNPLGVYGASKEAGERAIREALREHLILRTAWVYSAHGHNFVKTMLRLAGERPVLRVVADQTGSPTSAADVAGAIALIAQRVADGNAAWGTYHFTGAGTVTWHGFAETIVDLASRWRGPPPRIEAIATVDYPTPARRPANSVLDCSRITAVFGIEPRPWRAALAEVIEELYAAS